MLRVIIILLLSAPIAISCRSNGILVKFKNISNENFKELNVKVGEALIFKDLLPSKSTKFIKLKGIHRYCYARVIIPSDTLLFFQPIDYVGEKLFTKGKFIMKIGIEIKEGNKHLTVNGH